MKRRDFITFVGGAAAAPVLWPRSARAQQRDGVRRIGALMDTAESNPEGRARVAAFKQGLRQSDGSKAATSASTCAGAAATSRARTLTRPSSCASSRT